MNNLKELLDNAVSVDDALVDPAADLARGHRGLRKRRAARAGVGAAGLAVLATVTGVVVTSTSQAPARGPAIAVPRSSTAPDPGPTTVDASPGKLSGIALVAYAGKQVPGYTVKLVPKGWEIQGGNNTTLTIAPKSFKNQDVNDWVGKIAVMLESKDAAQDRTPITKDDLKAWGMEGESLGSTESQVMVNGNKGSLLRDDSTNRRPMVRVSFPDSKGHHVVAQGPLSLHWSDAQWVEFAEGVTVLGNAEQGLG
jgi:hypothetical protein